MRCLIVATVPAACSVYQIRAFVLYELITKVKYYTAVIKVIFLSFLDKLDCTYSCCHMECGCNRVDCSAVIHLPHTIKPQIIPQLGVIAKSEMRR